MKARTFKLPPRFALYKAVIMSLALTTSNTLTPLIIFVSLKFIVWENILLHKWHLCPERAQISPLDCPRFHILSKCPAKQLADECIGCRFNLNTWDTWQICDTDCCSPWFCAYFLWAHVCNDFKDDTRSHLLQRNLDLIAWWTLWTLWTFESEQKLSQH